MSLRKKIIAANWKMNLLPSEVETYFSTLKLELAKQDLEGIEVLIIPSYPALSLASTALEGLYSLSPSFFLGAQNFYFEERGAFTGEVSAAMLKDLFVRYVLVGHSERRTLFHESNDFIHKKLCAAHAHALHPILCIGETLKEREEAKEEEVLSQQLESALQGLSEHHLLETVIAYEPVWAIGTGKVATLEQIEHSHSFIRSVIRKLSSQEIAQKIRIQYGGSVTSSNAEELFASNEIDGALVGGASLDPRSFAKIISSMRY